MYLDRLKNTREGWLLYSVELLKIIFDEKGYAVPNVRVSCAIPSTSRRGNAVGQCWGSSHTDDNVNEIYISPVLYEPVSVLDTLVHELVHAVDDCKHSHGKEFKEIAIRIGLQGKMRGASAGPELKSRLGKVAAVLISEYGPYPHSKMRVPTTINQRSRKHPKSQCKKCGFTVSMLTSHLHIGPPICPKDMVLMERKGEWESD
jgi:SprT-like family